MQTGTPQLLQPPPVRQLLGGAVLQSGNHVNKVWRAMAGLPGSTEPANPMAIKYLEDHQVLAAELACALAGQILRLPVPTGAIVVAQPQDLPGLPARLSQENYLLCYGSSFQWPDDSTARPSSAAGLEEWIWQKICHSNQGASGGAWDELVANPDRHCENVVFDGKTWWLIDHEYSLPRVGQVMQQFADMVARQSVLDDRAPCNTLAENMLSRRPNDHGLLKQPTQLARHRQALQELCDTASRWQTGLPDLDAVLQMTALYLQSIHLRLPALALHLGHRMNLPSAATLWDSSPST